MKFAKKLQERREKYITKRGEIESIKNRKNNLEVQNLEMKLETADNRLTLMKLQKDHKLNNLKLDHSKRKLRVEYNRQTDEQNRALLRDINNILDEKQE